jgi:hypothetical protein
MNRKDESNYRKIIVIDRRVCFTGGLNLGNEYFHCPPQSEGVSRINYLDATPLRPQIYHCVRAPLGSHRMGGKSPICATTARGVFLEVVKRLVQSNDSDQTVPAVRWRRQKFVK